MMIENLEVSLILILLTSALVTGMAKAGISGLGLISIPIMAISFGAKASTGVLLPMLIIADIYAVIYYHRSAEWKLILKILPPAIVGILIGIVTGNAISPAQFKTLLSGIVLVMIIIMVVRDLVKKDRKVPDSPWFAIVIGLVGGFATMIGNAAGPVFAVYLLSMRLPKNSFIGTGAWFFFIVNVFKVPFHVFVWETINPISIQYSLLALPVIMLGAWLGIRIVRLFPEKVYRWFIVVSTSLSALLLLM
ncbi:MAG: sulfite exporter TauE/SafE family protein [Bacteroidetes bacterium]|jgi:uncharacterized protein|nr:sulfite exporter TauE/SafE family protein [Bacteroidota bacterium]MBT4400096.1 sulfite exporter TauE/SafE family protein [Bacteroidota bacterium]MBT4411405.1 sulfite exporter TauE/SafE family protein [Bacteroidota bacterium]MBT5427637.1 sulfite exporter TauE/SafE family protein [Bacteroidota bacterium]MBT7095420.1 sulfite exporter TauE/SafE family protein [Bacteroidota bacterium]